MRNVCSQRTCKGILCHSLNLCGRIVRCCLRGGKNGLTRKRINPRTRRIFLDGLRRYRERGVRILLDGKEVDIEAFGVIFEEQPDGSFYMGDYVLEESAEFKGAFVGSSNLKENHAGYGNEIMDRYQKGLKEIRFDKVYNR